MKSIPPTVEQVNLAAEALGKRDLETVLHLCLPCEELPSLSVLTDENTIRYRGFVNSFSRETVVDDVLSLVKKAVAGSDTFLNLDSPAETWVKIIMSGTRKIAFGSNKLFTMPLVTATPDVSNTEIYRVIQLLRENNDINTFRQNANFKVEGDAKCIILSSKDKSAPSSFETFENFDPHDLSLQISQTLKIKEEGYLSLGFYDSTEEFELHFSDSENIFVIPVVHKNGALNIGVDTLELLELEKPPAPEGWVWRGWEIWSDSMVGEHLLTGLTARIRAK